MSVQHESRPGVLKNRPLPSTVAVTLLGVALAALPGARSGIAIMMARRSPATSPLNRSLMPLSFGRSMLSHSISVRDQFTSASMLPNNEVLMPPSSPQPDAGACGAGSQTPAMGQRHRPSRANFSPADFNLSCACNAWGTGVVKIWANTTELSRKLSKNRCDRLACQRIIFRMACRPILRSD